MAKPKDDKKQEGKGGSGGLIVALAILTVIAGGGGFLFSTKILPSQGASHTAAAAPDGHDAHAPADGHGNAPEARRPLSGDLIALPPIFANLANPPNSYVRLEGSIVVESGFSDGKVLAAKVSEDVIALLKTMQLSQLNGASGMYHLREDINDRVKIRSEGKASELIINTLVIE